MFCQALRLLFVLLLFKSRFVELAFFLIELINILEFLNQKPKIMNLPKKTVVFLIFNF